VAGRHVSRNPRRSPRSYLIAAATAVLLIAAARLVMVVAS
jgi:hypothetical protein